MVQQFDPDVCRKIMSTVETLRSGAIARLPQAIEVVLEQAKSSGSPTLISNSTNAAEVGVPALTKAYNELLDCCDQYTAKAKSTITALGGEV